MSKINVKLVLKSEDGEYKFEGKGLKQENKIIFFENNIKTVIIFKDVITLIRTKDYQITLNFKLNEILEGYLITDNLKLNYKIKTTKLIIKNNQIKINYTLLNDKKIGKFSFNLTYSIDT